MLAHLAVRCVTVRLLRSVLPLGVLALSGTVPDAQGGWNWNEDAKLTASDVRYGNRFGWALSMTGDRCLIGSPSGENDQDLETGTAYVMEWSGIDWVPGVKLAPDDGTGGELFGHSVCLSADTALAGAPLGDGPTTDCGTAYVFVRSGERWVQQAKLVASDGEVDDQFGISVALDGDTALVGAPFNDDAGPSTGSAYVFVRSGTTWTQQAKITVIDWASGDEFGYSVSLSGETALIGARGYHHDSGTAYVFVRLGTSWPRQARLVPSDAAYGDELGYSVSLSGESALVGAPFDDNGAGTWSGSAYVFVRSGVSWSKQGKLVPADSNYDDRFGYAVSLSGDSAMACAPGDDHSGHPDAGSAYEFTRSGTVWSEEHKLTASDATSGDPLADSVSHSGDRCLLGAPYDNDAADVAGSAYPFVYTGSDWTEQEELTANDGGGDDSLGYAVFLRDEIAAVGAPGDDDAGHDAGSVYMYDLYGPEWARRNKLTAADASADASFGCAISLSGETALIGADGDTEGGADAGAAYVFERTGGPNWSQQAKLMASDATTGDAFGRAVGVLLDTALVGAPFDDDAGADSGSLYVFTRTGSTWSPQAKLTAGDDGAANDRFGSAISPWIDTAAVGAPFNDDAGTDSGAVYIFERTGSSWSQPTKLIRPDAAAGDWFGASLALWDDTALIGAPGDGDAGTWSGSAYVFVRTGSTWTQQAKLTAPDAAAGDEFGFCVSLCDDMAVVTAPGDDDAGDASGSAYVFQRWGTVWTLQGSKLVADDGSGGDKLGHSVCVCPWTSWFLLTGSPFDDDADTDTGSAYVFEGEALATVTFRNAGSNPVSYHAITNPILGGTYQATVDLGTTGHTWAVLVGYSSPLSLPLGGGLTVLVDFTDPNGELLGVPSSLGTLASFDLDVPADIEFAGFRAATQALHIGGLQPFALSNALDLFLGF